MAAGNVARGADIFMSRGPAKVGGDVLAFVGEANQFSPAFDHDAETLQPGD